MLPDSKPTAGIDYPRNIREFERWFDSEASCRDYVFRLRWPTGRPMCPRCGTETPPWITARGYLHCRDCGRETSVTAGTVFERSHTPLRTWFQAMWLLMGQKPGASASGLQKVLGLGSYETAWMMLHKLRRAMVRPGRERLHGVVEVDETYVGGVSSGGKQGRGAGKKEVVVIALEMRAPKGFGRVRMRRIADVSGVHLVSFVSEVVEPGSEIRTDGWAGYNKLSDVGYMHNKILLCESGDPAHVLMPGVHRISSLVKRWLLGTHQGAISRQHLEYYLDEFTFRFNRRTSASRGMLFYRLMQQAVATDPTPYREIIGGNHNI
ncbi:MAG TPA: IS1595 family transposase [Candidatus Hydrogenedentes bacterium]|nr:IS1595 family transposase [Candidatus Hydrogenedentota bacterium]